MHSRGAMRPGFALQVLPHENQGRREYRARNAPAALRAKIKKHTSVVTTGSPATPGIPRAMVYGFLRALPGEPRSFATVVSGLSPPT
jgi:hypothetical protein